MTGRIGVALISGESGFLLLNLLERLSQEPEADGHPIRVDTAASAGITSAQALDEYLNGDVA